MPTRPQTDARAGMAHLLISLFLLAGDLTAAGLAAAAALGLHQALSGPAGSGLDPSLLPTLLLLPVAYLHAGLYPGYGCGAVDQLRLLSRSTTLVVFLVFLTTCLLGPGAQRSPVALLYTWLFALFLVPLGRALLRCRLVRTPWWGEPVVVLGAAKTAELAVRRLLENPGLGLRPVACLDDDPSRHGTTCGGVPVIGSLALAPRLAATGRVRSALIAMPGVPRQRVLQVIDQHAACFARVRIIPDLLGVPSHQVSARDLQGIVALEVRPNLLDGWNRLLKRVMDLVLSLPLLLAAGPVILLAALAVKLNSPGPGFYAQEREGLHGRRIRVWKVRTMVPDADAVLEQHLASDLQARAEWERHMKLRHDPRIVPRVGAFLRRYSLDELPQLWNVVKGEMSLVGPRPFPEYHLSKFSSGFRVLRRRVPPGMTGLWQVSARSEGDLAVQEELDTYYIRNWSPWLDLYLLARTARAVLSGRGAY